MNIKNILTEIEKTDPEVYNKLDTRRNVMKGFAGTGAKIALAALPLALGSLFNKAYSGPRNTSAIVDVLQFALTLEYLEYEFYRTAVSSPGLIPAGPAAGAITTIRDHEQAHVNFLKSTIIALGSTPVSQPTFDFTAGNGSGTGPFLGVFSNYALFLAVAQVFEDTGVRAYKGQAGNLIANNDVLTAALQIHSVEARHAAHIRAMRRTLGAAIPAGVNVKSWITLNQSGIAAPYNTAVQPSYNGEELTTQAGVNIINIGGQTISAEAASEAFDEPLTDAQVLAIVGPFIV